jgi:hypothetical protein
MTHAGRTAIVGTCDGRRNTTTGIPLLHPGEWYAPMRPNGRRGCRVFGSPFRAAEHAMNAFGVSTWTELRDKGWSVCVVQS